MRSGPDVPREIRMSHELARWPTGPGRHQPDPLAVVQAHEAHRLCDVAVVTHDDCAIVDVQPAIVEEMHCQIDVGALLLGADYLRRAPVSDRLRERRSDPMAEEMPEVHLDLWTVTLQGAEIDVLSLGLRWIRGGARYSCREVLDYEDVVLGLEDLGE